MSTFFTLSGKSSYLTSKFTPPIVLSKNQTFVIGLTDFESFNSIANVTAQNNVIKIGKTKLTIPTGAYEISDISDYVNKAMKEKKYTNPHFELFGNNNTMKTHLHCSEIVDFNFDNSIGPLLGFNREKLEPSNVIHQSSHQSNILKINSICIDCNIATGSYHNGQVVHYIHQFFPRVPPGYKIIEVPKNIIYLPITTNIISDISIKILDQDGDLVSFGEEVVSVGLHLKRDGYYF